MLLRRAEHGAPRIGQLGTLCRIDRIRAAAARARAGFVRPVLAVVEHEEVGEIAMPGTQVDARARPEGNHLPRHRHVLVPGAVGRGAPREEPFGRVERLRAVVGVVVLDLVVIPGDEPRTGEVRRLQIRVGLVERVAAAVIIQRDRLARAMAANGIAAERGFVDVITEVHDELGLVGDDVAIGAEVALLIVLAGREGEAQARGPRGRRRRSVRRADAACRFAGRESIPVATRGREPEHFDVQRMRLVGRGIRRSGRDHVMHLLIACDFPADRKHFRRHAAARGERHRRKARPDHEAAG